MRKTLLLIPAAAVCVAGLAGLAASTSGAYFEAHTPSKGISGTTAVVNVANGTGDIAFANMLPGESQTVHANFTNTGSVAEDVYVSFPNATALSALNNLGTYGEAHITSSKIDGEVFASANLNDNTSTCPPGSTSVEHPVACTALMSSYKVASKLAPGDSGTFSFSFNYASKLHGGAAAGNWNSYPAAGQVHTNAADGTGAGLPYQFVATQPGINPGA